MSLPLKPPLPPMEAELVAELPGGAGWQHEPKWDGFRCIAWRDGDDVHLQSKAGKPLARYFPDVVDALRAAGARRFVADGEIVVPVGGTLSFDELQLRLHPAASRVEKLAAARPASYVVFDLLVTERGRSLLGEPLSRRRPRLEGFFQRYLDRAPRVALTPATTDSRTARRWLERSGGGLDGVVSKLLGAPYASGERTGMVKVKPIRTADCVVGGFRRGRGGGLASLLLGLHDDEGLLHHVGFTSTLSDEQRRAFAPVLDRLASSASGAGFTGRSPGAPSRWSRGRDTAFVPVRPELVVEVAFDQASGGRFRHGTRLVRTRPDKAPAACMLDQLAPPRASPVSLAPLR